MREQRLSRQNFEKHSSNMEIRNRRLYSDSDSASFQMSFTEVDVRRALVNNYATQYYCVGTKAQEYYTREDIEYILSSISVDLRNSVGGKYSRDLALWAFRLAERKGFVIPVSSGSNLYQLSEKLKNDAVGQARREGSTF